MFNNKKFITLFLAFVFFQAICATVMKKEEVLKLNTKLSECPSYALTLGLNGDKYCHYNFYCVKDECYSPAIPIFDAAPSVDDKNGKDLKIEAVCKTNDDCLSNVCNNGRCDNTSLTQCIVRSDGKSVSCGKLSTNVCEKDDECASGNCSLGRCEVVFQNEIVEVVKTSLYIVLALILLAVVCCIGICICICCCIKKRRNNKNLQMV